MVHIQRPPAKDTPVDPRLSDSAGSLFSEKDASSPDVALKSLPTQAPHSQSIPMKRPSVDDGPLQRPVKRKVVEMPMQITATAGNATKARLAQRAPQPPTPTVVPAPKKLDLSKLSFKKNTATVTGASPAQISPTVQSPTIPPLPRRSASVSDHSQSPAPGGPGMTEGMGPPPHPNAETMYGLLQFTSTSH